MTSGMNDKQSCSARARALVKPSAYLKRMNEFLTSFQCPYRRRVVTASSAESSSPEMVVVSGTRVAVLIASSSLGHQAPVGVDVRVAPATGIMGAHVEDDDGQPDRAEQRAGEYVGRVVHAAVHTAGSYRQGHRRADSNGDDADPPIPTVPEDDCGNRAVEADGGSGVARGKRRGRRRFVEMRDARPWAVDEERRRRED